MIVEELEKLLKYTQSDLDAMSRWQRAAVLHETDIVLSLLGRRMYITREKHIETHGKVGLERVMAPLHLERVSVERVRAMVLYPEWTAQWEMLEKQETELLTLLENPYRMAEVIS